MTSRSQFDRFGGALAAVCAVAAVLAAAGTCQGQLSSAEVVVVANANAKGSVELARYYCRARDILEDRLVILRTDPGLTVSRADYDKQIRDPLRKFLRDKKLEGEIRCLALIWGVPVRVLGREPTDVQTRTVSAYRRARQRLHGRMAVNLKLLRTVGEDFPKPRQFTLRPVGMLFDPKAAARIGNPPSFGTLTGRFASELKHKDKAIARITDPAKQTIARRQLLGLRLDVYGLGPLAGHLPEKTFPSLPTAEEIRQEIEGAGAELNRLRQGDQTPEAAAKVVKLVVALRGVAGAYKACEGLTNAVDPAFEDASVDSELALLWEEGYRLNSALPNPMHWRLASMTPKPAHMPKRMLLTARIDGPTPRDALRIIKDSIAAEKTGVEGKFYVDAGGKYPHYDKHLISVAQQVKKTTKIPVVLDTRKELFPAHACQDAALYVGWYSLRKYVPAFTWSKGAVGWHVASFEAQHLRSASSEEWCVKMIQNGVAATLGAVNEPFVQAFPLPQDFFALLLTGRYSVAECYWRTVPNTSWRLTLIADPLYNPYKLHPKLSIYQLSPELAGRTPTTAPAPRRVGP